TKTDLSCNSFIIFQGIGLRHTANRPGAVGPRANQFSRIALITDGSRESDSCEKQIVMSCPDSHRKLNGKRADYPSCPNAIEHPAVDRTRRKPVAGSDQATCSSPRAFDRATTARN